MVAEHFAKAADASMELEYWTAAGVLIVHSVIALTDALCIKLSGQRSAGDDHEGAVEFVDALLPAGEEKRKAIAQLRRIIEEKTRVSYLGILYAPREVHGMWKRLQQYRAWVLGILIPEPSASSSPGTLPSDRSTERL